MGDYYDILGIDENERNLQGEEFEKIIKKKHRELALKWHPDRWVNGTEEEKQEAENKFKQINEAYTTLSDSQKRQEYDFSQSGGGFNPFEGMAGFNPFSGMEGFMQGFRQRGSVVHRGADIEYELTITLKEAYSGTSKTITYDKPIKCSHCHGTGAKNGTVVTCPHCNGTGMISQRRQNGNMISIQSSPCPYCRGTGKIIPEECPECGGMGVIKEKATATITVPGGVDENMVFVVEGLGGESNDGGPNGNLHVIIKHITDSGPFIKDGTNIIYEDVCHYTDALLGHDGKVSYLDGRDISYTIPELSKDGYEKRIANKGMPILNQYGQIMGRGDFIIRVRCKYPNRLTKKDRDAIKSLKHD